MIPPRMPGKSMRERSRNERGTPRRPRRTNPIRVRHNCADFTSLANATREALANSDTVQKTQRVVMAVGLTGPGPDLQNQERYL